MIYSLIVQVGVAIVLVTIASGSLRRNGKFYRAGVPFLAVLSVGYITKIWQLLLPTAIALLVFWLWRARGWSTRSFAVCVAGLCAGMFALDIFAVHHRVAELHRLQRGYPFESMETRAPEPKGDRPAALSKDASKQLVELESRVDGEHNGFRNSMLEQLHDDSVERFIASPGFGMVRRFTPTEGRLKVNLERPLDQIVPQPRPRLRSTTDDEILASPLDVDRTPLRSLHLESIVDFAFPAGFGLVESRRKTAGFLSHRFSQVPQAKPWTVESIELVGLLLHDEPIVYVSENLPRMEAKDRTARRPLDAFETDGLKRLRGGDDLSIRGSNVEIRMLGAVRSAQQCAKCHGGERGDLLGAFSYRLRRDP